MNSSAAFSTILSLLILLSSSLQDLQFDDLHESSNQDGGYSGSGSSGFSRLPRSGFPERITSHNVQDGRRGLSIPSSISGPSSSNSFSSLPKIYSGSFSFPSSSSLQKGSSELITSYNILRGRRQSSAWNSYSVLPESNFMGSTTGYNIQEDERKPALSNFWKSIKSNLSESNTSYNVQEDERKPALSSFWKSLKSNLSESNTSYNVQEDEQKPSLNSSHGSPGSIPFGSSASSAVYSSEPIFTGSITSYNVPEDEQKPSLNSSHGSPGSIPFGSSASSVVYSSEPIFTGSITSYNVQEDEQKPSLNSSHGSPGSIPFGSLASSVVDLSEPIFTGSITSYNAQEDEQKPSLNSSSGSIKYNIQGDERELPDERGSPRLPTGASVEWEGKLSSGQRDENLENACILPEYPEGGSYELGGCTKPCNKRSGDKVPKMSILIYNCKNNYVLNGNTISVCIDGTWYNPPSCFKICPALRSTSVNINCSYQGETVSCNKHVIPGTRASLSCKPSYKLPLTSDPGYRQITCLNDGFWDHHIFRCLPECGTSVAQGSPLIVGGFEAKVGTFPWHVGVYRKKVNMTYEQICSGSLIGSNLVVSAAHCFYDEASNKLNDVSNYAVAAGKYYRAWNHEEEYEQKSIIKSIEIGRRYVGLRGNYAQDIALMKLKTTFELTTLVRPICLDWENTFEREQLQPGNSGKVVGWGKNISGLPTNTLFETDMPYVPYHQCMSGVPQNFIRYITPDKFCAGRLNGSSLCDGDSGGGLCFQKDGIWYLRGIVSLSPAKGNVCDYNSYVAFTHVSHFTDWIRNAYVNS